MASYEVASPLPLYQINRTLAETIKNDQVSERVKVELIRQVP